MGVELLISHRFPIDQAEAAYQLLDSDEPSLGILLEYPSPEQQSNEFLTARTARLISSPPHHPITLNLAPPIVDFTVPVTPPARC